MKLASKLCYQASLQKFCSSGGVVVVVYSSQECVENTFAEHCAFVMNYSVMFLSVTRPLCRQRSTLPELCQTCESIDRGWHSVLACELFPGAFSNVYMNDCQI